MAEQEQESGAELDHNQFCCSVCLDLLKEPVAIPCGHSYCKTCIEGCWDPEEGKGQYSCPQCREVFSPRPVLRRNNMLAEAVEMVKKKSIQQAPPPAAVACANLVDVAGPADVACDFCCGSTPNKATMSCLTCLASYCPTHLEPHYSVPVLKRHQLVSATIPLQEKMCTKHNKLMEIYCQTDKKCICYLCIIDEHKGHCTVSAAAERALEQKQLTACQKQVQNRSQEREKDLKKLGEALKDFKSCSQTAVKTCDKIMNELIASIKENSILVKQLIVAREKTAVAEAEALQLQLQEEITKLRERDAKLEQLSHVDDHIHFIQVPQHLYSDDVLLGPVVRPQRSFKIVTNYLFKLRKDIEILLKDISPTISMTVSTIDAVLPPEPKTREEFLKYCCPLTLDENSISQFMSISQKNRVTYNNKNNSYGLRDYNRYDQVVRRPAVYSEVLCREGLSQRCYWEVTLSGHTWSVAVSYKDESRSSSHNTEFGNDNVSWCLVCSPEGLFFRHNNQSVKVSRSQSYPIGVFLDYNADTLSFYNVNGSRMTLLHKVQTTFTQPLYAGLGLKDDGSKSCSGYYAELLKLQ